jgi:hypothetical protein
MHTIWPFLSSVKLLKHRLQRFLQVDKTICTVLLRLQAYSSTAAVQLTCFEGLLSRNPRLNGFAAAAPAVVAVLCACVVAATLSSPSLSPAVPEMLLASVAACN